MFVKPGSAPERFFTQITTRPIDREALRGDSAGMHPRLEHHASRWWIKRGHRGRMAVVSYKPFPGEQVGSHGFKYHTDAFEELERLERKRERRRAVLEVLGFLFIVLAVMVVGVPQ